MIGNKEAPYPPHVEHQGKDAEWDSDDRRPAGGSA